MSPQGCRNHRRRTRRCRPVDKDDTLEPAMRQWLAVDGPALLPVRVNRTGPVMPPGVELSQVASPALFGVKAVPDGRAGEVPDLLRNHFLR